MTKESRKCYVKDFANFDFTLAAPNTLNVPNKDRFVLQVSAKID